MRGKDDGTLPEPISNRITPAYAGKSIYGSAVRHDCIGSPPPMRGKAPAYDPKQANNRITPAYAGKR